MCLPKISTSSPTCASVSVISIIQASMQIFPTIGARFPLTITSPTPRLKWRSNPSAYPYRNNCNTGVPQQNTFPPVPDCLFRLHLTDDSNISLKRTYRFQRSPDSTDSVQSDSETHHVESILSETFYPRRIQNMTDVRSRPLPSA